MGWRQAVATSHAEYCSVEEDVFATGEFRMKADPHFQKTTNATAEHDPAFGRLSNAAEDLEKRTLAGPIAPFGWLKAWSKPRLGCGSCN